MIEFFSLRMMPGKALNNYTRQAELVYKRCKTNCGFELSASGLAKLLVQQLRLRNEDLLRLLFEFQGRLPSNPDGLLHFKQKAKAHLKIVRPQQFTRTHHLSEHHPETQVPCHLFSMVVCYPPIPTNNSLHWNTKLSS